MIKDIKIRNTAIGNGNDVFIIAEAGVNHGGDFKVAKKMVEVAAEAGANAVTFQHIIGGELNVKQPGPKNLNWDSWLLKDEEMKELFRLAKEKGLLCTACVIDKKSVDKMIDYGADFFKVVSGDITAIPFLKYCAAKGLPIFLSTGAATLGEIESAIAAIKSKGNDKIILYHTNTHYPTPPKEVNLRSMVTLKSAFEQTVGFCDHTAGYLAPLVACALGANVIEKHFTLDRNKKGPDYQVSLEPGELKEMIAHIRNLRAILGSAIKGRLDSEQATYKSARRSIVAGCDIPQGTQLTESMLVFKRPGTGICPSLLDHVVAHKARKDIREDEIIAWNMIEAGAK